MKIRHEDEILRRRIMMKERRRRWSEVEDGLH